MSFWSKSFKKENLREISLTCGCFLATLSYTQGVPLSTSSNPCLYKFGQSSSSKTSAPSFTDTIVSCPHSQHTPFVYQCVNSCSPLYHQPYFFIIPYKPSSYLFRIAICHFLISFILLSACHLDCLSYNLYYWFKTFILTL